MMPAGTGGAGGSIDTLRLFSIPVTIVKVAGADELNAALLPEIESVRRESANAVPKNWVSSLFTTMISSDRLHRRPGFRRLSEIASAEAEEFAHRKAVDLDTQALRLTRCWINILESGQSMDAHVHPNSAFTAIYFVAAPAKGGPLVMHAPNKDIGFAVPVLEENDLNRDAAGYRPAAGEMLLFDSHVLHGVRANGANDAHINVTMTFTIFGRGD